MPFCVFRKSDGVYIRGVRWGSLPVDDATEVGFDLPDYPVNVRWDGGLGVRPLTAAEIAQIRNARTFEFISPPERQTLIDVFLDIENRLRVLEGQPAILRGQVVTRLRALFDSYL